MKKNLNINNSFIVLFVHTSSISILVQLLLEYSNYSNSAAFRYAELIRVEVLIEGGAYFNVDNQRCGTY